MNPTRVIKGISTSREVISPFQYYTELNETIYCLVFSDHQTVAKLFLHYDAEHRLLARALVSDNPDMAETLYSELRPPEESLSPYECGSVDFQDLLLEMHLASCNDSARLYDENELQALLAMYPKPPIIIGGCGRSGTTLLLSILSSHPSIYAIPNEVYAFYPKPFRLQRLLHILSQLDEQPSPLRWCEKTPKNVRVFGDILSVFNDNVRLIHIVRDGRDVVTSVHPYHPGRYWVSTERWVADMTAGLKYEENALLVRYEDLILDTEKTLRRICEYVEEPFDPCMLDFQVHTSVRQNVAWERGTVKPLHQSRIGRWQSVEYNDVIEEFLANPQAVSLMRRLNYL
jgi:hypothetical protein